MSGPLMRIRDVVGLLAVFTLASCGGGASAISAHSSAAPVTSSGTSTPGASIKMTGAYTITSTDSKNQVFCGSSTSAAPYWVPQGNRMPGNWVIYIQGTPPASIYMDIAIAGYKGSGQYSESQVTTDLEFRVGTSSIGETGGHAVVKSGQGDSSGELTGTFGMDQPYYVDATFTCLPVRS